MFTHIYHCRGGPGTYSQRVPLLYSEDGGEYSNIDIDKNLRVTLHSITTLKCSNSYQYKHSPLIQFMQLQYTAILSQFDDYCYYYYGISIYNTLYMSTHRYTHTQVLCIWMRISILSYIIIYSVFLVHIICKCLHNGACMQCICYVVQEGVLWRVPALLFWQLHRDTGFNWTPHKRAEVSCTYY